MKRLLFFFVAIVLIGAAIGLFVTWPERVDANRFASLSGDAEVGAQVFWAGGCASCHAAEGSDEPTLLSGGKRFATDFGTFIAPNISSDPTNGLGAWSLTQFASAMLHGTSPDGTHYYPSFPYSTYTRMSDQDVADLWAFLRTLPPSEKVNEPHDLKFPFNVRLTLGGWKLLFLSDDWVAEVDGDQLERGRYLVEALGHCGECHTPRNALGGPDLAHWMAGAPNPSGKGRIPGITPGQLDWSAQDIAYYLETGFTPDFDSAGGEMAEVIENMSRLTGEDRAAIAAYVKALPPVE